MGVETVLQGALHSALTADPDVMAIAQSVRDVQPQASDSASSAPFPFVTIGDITVSQDDTDALIGFIALCRVHSFSQSGSQDEVKRLQGAIFDALHRQESALTMSGYNLYSFLREDSFVMVDDDQRFHGVCEYRALIGQTS